MVPDCSKIFILYYVILVVEFHLYFDQPELGEILFEIFKMKLNQQPEITSFFRASREKRKILNPHRMFWK